MTATPNFIPLTVRAFDAATRISTAVAIQDGSVLEVYPLPKKTHPSWEAWKAQYPTARFEEQPAKTAHTAKMRSHISYPVPTDTPLQATVRQISFLYGRRRTTLRCRGPLVERNCAFTQIWVLRQESLVQVYFNFDTGTVMFGNKVVTDLPLDDLTFFYQPYGNGTMAVIKILPDLSTPGGPVIVLFPRPWSRTSLVTRLHTAGFSVLFCRIPIGGCESYYAKFAHTLPNVKAVLEDRYDTVTPYTADGRRMPSITIDQWLALPPTEKKIESPAPLPTSTPA